ncbi:MAG: hypothetical protein SWJ54_02035 [Cyanobacteriota bacterium]|nr:hypothetical protein [Cyanobacteriota bacterium]
MARRFYLNLVQILPIFFCFELFYSLDLHPSVQAVSTLGIEVTQEQVIYLAESDSELPKKGESRRDFASS